MEIKKIVTASILGLLLFTTPVMAESPRPSGTPPYKRGLSELRLRSCEARQDAVKNRMSSLVKFATNMEDKFDSIATRVEDFYTNKVLPTGKVVSNYDTLVKDISTKKDVVNTDIVSAQAKVDAFSCTGDDPKGLLTQFRLDMQKVKGDLKNYRTSIKNLIVAVKPLAPTGSPKPSETPESNED